MVENLGRDRGRRPIMAIQFYFLMPTFQERKLIKLPDFVFCTFEGSNKETK